MPRGLSTAIKDALNAAQVEFYHLVRFEFSSPIYLTTAPYDITYDGNVYLSTALISKIPSVKETLKIKPNTFTLETAGASLDMQALSLATDKLNTEVYIYRYIVGASDAVLINKGFIDGYKASEDRERGTSSINWVIANHWSNWDMKNDFLLTDDNQKARYPGDEGLRYIAMSDWIAELWGLSYRDANSVVTFSDTIRQENSEYYQAALADLGSDYSLSELYDRLWDVQLESPVFKELSKGFEARPLPIVYGKRAVTGIPVYRNRDSGGTTSHRDLYVVYALAAGECEALVDMYLDDNISYTDAKYSSNVFVTFYSGTDTQSADPTLVSLFNSNIFRWSADSRLRGICYAVVKYIYDPEIFPGGEPTPTFEIKGKKQYDFEAVEETEKGKTIYRCEDCGVTVECD